MPDLEEIAASVGDQIIASFLPAFKRLEAQFSERLAALEAASIKNILIDDGKLLLIFGDGAARSLGQIIAKDGENGRDGIDAPEIDLSPLLARLDALAGLSVTEASIDDEGELRLLRSDGSSLAAGRVVGRDGIDGKDGADAPILDLDPILARLDAVKACAVTGAMIDRSGDLLLLRADGSNLNAGKVVGQDGRDAIDGKDGEIGPAGLGFEDLDATLAADGRTIVLSFQRGEVVRSFELELPAMIYRGVYEAGTEYRSGDACTFGGSLWVANCPTATRPGEGADWTLAAKRGRDGKDFAGPALSGSKIAKLGGS